jgi:hypothetical protein
MGSRQTKELLDLTERQFAKNIPDPLLVAQPIELRKSLARISLDGFGKSGGRQGRTPPVTENVALEDPFDDNVGQKGGSVWVLGLQLTNGLDCTRLPECHRSSELWRSLTTPHKLQGRGSFDKPFPGTVRML